MYPTKGTLLHTISTQPALHSICLASHISHSILQSLRLTFTSIPSPSHLNSTLTSTSNSTPRPHPHPHPPAAKQEADAAATAAAAAKAKLFIEIEPTPLANRQPFSSMWEKQGTGSDLAKTDLSPSTATSLGGVLSPYSVEENLSPFGRAPMLSPTTGAMRDPLVTRGKIDPQKEALLQEERTRKNTEATARLRDLEAEGERDDERIEQSRKQRLG